MRLNRIGRRADTALPDGNSVLPAVTISGPRAAAALAAGGAAPCPVEDADRLVHSLDSDHWQNDDLSRLAWLDGLHTH